MKEIEENKTKIKILTDYTDHDLKRIIELITGRIRFINARLISKKSYQSAEFLVRDIDEDDTEFIALTEHIRGKFWSGDKELRRGLMKKNWNKFITTVELFQQLK